MSFNKIDIENNIRADEPHKILIYGYTKEEKEYLEKIFWEYKEENYVFLTKNSLNMKVKDLVYNDNIDSTNTDSNENFPNVKFMLLSGFSNKEVHQFFNIFKCKKIKRPITSLLTTNNKEWFFKDLIKDVYKEHIIMMNKMKEIQKSKAIN